MNEKVRGKKRKPWELSVDELSALPTFIDMSQKAQDAARKAREALDKPKFPPLSASGKASEQRARQKTKNQKTNENEMDIYS